MGQTRLQISPMPAVVERIKQSIASPGKQQSLAIRIFGDDAHVRQLMARQAAGDFRPGSAEIGGLVDERLAIVHQVIIHRNIRSARIEERRLNAGDGPPRRHPRNVLRHVIPVRAGVFRVPDLAVVGTRPDQAFLHRRRSNRKHNFAIKLPQIIADDSAGGHDVFRILRGKIRADHAPALPAIGGPENHLAAVIHRVVIERIDGQRSRPVAAVLRVIRRRIERMQPRTHRSRQLGPRVPASNFIAITSRPHDVWIGRIRVSETRFAASHAAVPARLRRASESAETDLHRRPAHGGVVLHVAVEVIRDLVIHRHVIHLPHWAASRD